MNRVTRECLRSDTVRPCFLQQLMTVPVLRFGVIIETQGHSHRCIAAAAPLLNPLLQRRARTRVRTAGRRCRRCRRRCRQRLQAKRPPAAPLKPVVTRGSRSQPPPPPIAMARAFNKELAATFAYCRAERPPTDTVDCSSGSCLWPSSARRPPCRLKTCWSSKPSTAT